MPKPQTPLPDAIRAHIAAMIRRPAHRDGAVFIRDARIKHRATDEGEAFAGDAFEVIASSARAVEMYGWREVLVHKKGSIDTSSCRSLLLHHQGASIIGGVSATTLRDKDGELDASVTVHEKAISVAQVPIRDLVRDGALAGVSIGYAYEEADCAYDEDSRTLTVNKWRLLEISLTPTQADATAHVKRSLPDFIHPQGREAQKGNAVRFSEWLKARGLKKADLSTEELARLRSEFQQEHADGVIDDDEGGEGTRAAGSTPAAPPSTPAAANAPAADAVLTIARQAEELGLRASDYVALDIEAARAAMLRDIGAQRAQQQRTPRSPAQVTHDEADKIRDEAVDIIVTGRSFMRSARTFARRSGIEGANEWEREDAADWIFRHFAPPTRETLRLAERIAKGQRAAVDTSTFANVTGLAALKIMQNGYTSYKTTWQRIAKAILRADFKAVSVPGLQTAVFGAAPGEGNAFADLSQGASSGTGTNEFRGALFEITKEAIYNDELDLYLDELRGIGRTGARTEEKIVFDALAAASFANATQALAFSEANLQTAWAAHAAITGPAGEPMGIPARLLVVPIALYIAAKTAVSTAQGETSKRLFADGETALDVIPGYYLSDANDWYLLTEPADAACLHLIQHPDYPVPMLNEIDAGGVAARKWRIEFPRKAFATAHAAGKPVGGYKCTQA